MNSLQNWMRQKEEVVNKRQLANIKEKKKRLRKQKEDEESLKRKLPIDILAEEWFTTDSSSAEVVVYLIKKLMPTLVLGMEKVLLEAEKRNLISSDSKEEHNPFDPLARTEFNPVNLLAQFLIRNNPKYSNFPEASPYVKGLREMAENLTAQVFDAKVNKVGMLKHEASLKRKELEQGEEKKLEEKTRRKILMQKQFKMWLLDESDKLQLQLVQNGLYSFLEISAHLSPDNIIQYSKELETTDETGKTITEDEFVEFLEEHLNDLQFQQFQEVLHHLNQCALAFRKTFEHEIWNSMFAQLFEHLDSESSGFVDRHRMLHLLEKFWDKIDDEGQKELRNPRHWPVIELEELDDLFMESEDESIEVSTLEDKFKNGDWTSNEARSDADDSVSLKENQAGDLPKALVTEGVIAPEPLQVKSGEEVSQVEVTEGVIEESEEKPEVDDKTPEEEISAETSESSHEQLQPTSPLEKPETPPPAAGEEVAKNETVESSDENKEVKDSEDEPQGQTDDQSEVRPETEDKPDDKPPVDQEQSTAADESEELPQTVSPVEDKDVDDASKPDKNAGEEDDKVEEKQTDLKEEKNNGKETLGLEEQLLRGDLGMPMTLNTPSESNEAVKIEFSKGKPQTFVEKKVRKTTSYTVVQPKKRVSDEKEKLPTEEVKRDNTDATNAVPQTTLPSQSGVQEDGASEFTSTFFEGSSHIVQQTVEDMKNEHLLHYPLDVKTRPGSASRMSVTFASEPVVLPEKPTQEFFSEFSSRSQSRMTSVFDENQLNRNRFILLLETFLSEDANHVTVEALVNFIHDGYIETEEEKFSRLARAHREALAAKHQEKIDNLFNKWDNDGQGYLDIDVIEDVLSKYKGGVEASLLKHGKLTVRKSRKHRVHDSRISRKEFHLYINAVCDAMTGGEEVFDAVTDFVTITVERTHAESVRGQARRRWLEQIKSSAECSGASMDPVYRAVFQALYKDADAHGNEKKVSGYIALLEKNTAGSSHGDLLLRYVASTPDNAPYLLGKAFYEDMRGISFYCVRRGKLVHVPRVHSHGGVYFWNPQRLEQEKEASLVLLPIKDDDRRVFGLLGIDNMDDPADRSIFSTHELNFFQAVARVFSASFHHVDLRRKLLRIVDSAMSWIHSRAPHIVSITMYMVEPDPKSSSRHVLRKMMFTDNYTGVTQIYKKPARLYRKDNLFSDYLFKCMEGSETTKAEAYGEFHTAYPLRDAEGRSQCVIDISLGKLRSLPKHEAQEMQRMLKLLQAANREVLKESLGGKKNVILEAEGKASEDMRVDIMFDRLMLTDLRENVAKLDSSVFAELHNYKIPPPIIHDILKAVLMLFHQEEEMEYFEDWVKCKQLATSKLKQHIVSFDPTASGAVAEAIVERISGLLKGIAHGAVARHGSKPAQQLYNWAFVCLSLIEHTKKAGDSFGQPTLTPITSASTATTTDTQDIDLY